MYSDKNLTCADCGQEFVFTASEQDFYAQRGFTEPRRCASCRASRKAARNADGGGSYGGYGASGGYSAGGGGELRRWRGLQLARSRTPRDVLGDLLVVRQGSPGSLPSDQRQAGLLQRLLPQPARRLTKQALSVRTDQRSAEPASIPDPGRQPTRVVRFPGDFGGSLSRPRRTACRRAARGRTCAPSRGADGRCCRRGPSRSGQPRPPSR